MAPSFRPSKNRPSRDEEDFYEARGDRKVSGAEEAAGAVDLMGKEGRSAAGGLRPRNARGGDERRPFPPLVGQARKPLVEKKRRARINESLQELRLILADAEVTLRLWGREGAVRLGRGKERRRSSAERAFPRLSSFGLLLVPDEDGERRGAGDDSEAGARDSAEEVSG